MVNAVAEHSCIYDSSTGTLTLRGLGSSNFSAWPGQVCSGGISSDFPSVFDRRKAAQNMALGRVLWDKIITRFSEENCVMQRKSGYFSQIRSDI